MDLILNLNIFEEYKYTIDFSSINKNVTFRRK